MPATLQVVRQVRWALEMVAGAPAAAHLKDALPALEQLLPEGAQAALRLHVASDDSLLQIMSSVATSAAAAELPVLHQAAHGVAGPQPATSSQLPPPHAVEMDWGAGGRSQSVAELQRLWWAVCLHSRQLRAVAGAAAAVARLKATEAAAEGAVRLSSATLLQLSYWRCTHPKVRPVSNVAVSGLHAASV